MVFDPAAIRSSYDRVAKRYADELIGELAYKPIDRALLGMLAEDVARAGGGKVADLGAGPGQIGAFVRGLGASVIAVDLSPTMAATARGHLGLDAVAGSLTALPLATNGLAAATAFYALIHLDDAGLEATAAELARVLRPGALLLVAVHIGEEVKHIDEWWGEAVDVDFRFLPTQTVVDHLTAASLQVEATLERAPHPEEYDTHRAYILARAP